jgi:CRP/FNR family transcriptional regulator, cyclic AMP receptor protein
VSSAPQVSAIARALAAGPPRGDAALGGEWADVLGDVPLFAGLSKRHRRRVAGLAGQQRFAEGTQIVREGARGETFYLILDGKATVERRGAAPLDLEAGDFFGEMALLDGGPRSATVTARTPVLVMRLSRRPFAKLLAKEPEVAAAMLRELARRLREAHAAALH